MHHWTKGIMGDDPAYLAVGTEVSAKYKGAFCEAKVRKVVRSVKCKVTFKQGLGSAVVTDDQVRGNLRVGSLCEVKHPERKEFVEATINKITDSSQYTVVFDDGDITTLRRTALCLKSGRHFAVSETLDQLPLTHPEHFSNPVIGGRKGRRSRQIPEDSSDEEETSQDRTTKKKEEKEADIGRVVCVELGDKKKQKDNWFPGLVVAPTAQDTVRIRVRDEYLVRSFKDGRYFTVPKKEATEFTRELGLKVDANTLRVAVEKALQFLDRDELPPHWDRDVLFGTDDSSAVSDSDAGLDSDSSDDEPREEKDHFVAQLYKFMDDRGTPINNEPAIGNKDIDLYKLFKVVHKLGGYNRVTNHNQWKTIARKIGYEQGGPMIKNLVKQAYKKFLHSFEDFYRKLGCTMVNHPRHGRGRHHAGRSLIRDRDRATPVNLPKDKDRSGFSASDYASTPEQSEREAFVEVIALGEASKSKVEEIIVVEKVPVEIVSTPVKKVKEDVTVASKLVKKEVIVKKEVASTKKEKDQGKKEKEVKKKKDAEEEKAKPLQVPKDVVTLVVKEVFVPSEKPTTSAVVKDAEPESTEKVVPATNSKTKEDKTKKIRECKVKLLKTRKGDPVTDKEREIVKEVVAIKVEKADCAENFKDDKEENLKSSEDEKSDDSKKVDTKEEEEKQTRSKSKEDSASRSDSTVSDRRSRDFDKPFIPRPKKWEEEDEPSRKRGRKRKDEPKTSADESLGHLAAGIAVAVGDKLKVYYGGPTQESKVLTYEAKVIEVKEVDTETFLVHYLGWNTRYDEWIKRGRIAENLSWTPSRAKRAKLAAAKLADAKPAVSKRGRPLGGKDRPRSATPSSVTSSSSRTKSPGTPAPRPTRPPLGPDCRRRTRRMSTHTDRSVASASTESDASGEESDAAPTRTRSRSERIADKDDAAAAKPEVKEEIKRTSLRRKPAPRKEANEADDETEEDSGEQSTETDAIGDAQVVEKRRSTRTRKLTSAAAEREEAKCEEEKSEEEQTQPKGRDFDLNQIRSELKGFDKAVKQPLDMSAPTTDEKEGKPSQLILDDKTGLIDVRRLSAEKDALAKSLEISGKVPPPLSNKPAALGKASPATAKTASPAAKPAPVAKTTPVAQVKAVPVGKTTPIPQAKAKAVPVSPDKTSPAASKLVASGKASPGGGNTDDIYEFKEPEPFEYEVRAKREPVVPEEKAKPTRKAAAKAGEPDPVTPKSDKSPTTRKKLVRTTTSRTEKEALPDEGTKKRFKRTVGKKAEVVVVEAKAESPPSKPEVTDPTTPQKANSSAFEEAFDKLCESPVFRPAVQRNTPSPSNENEPLSLFNELPGEGKDDDGDDNEDRLVISETDETEAESEGPLFSYSQRHHEELFPTMSSDLSLVSPESLNMLDKPKPVLPVTSMPLSTSAALLAAFSKSTDSSKVKPVAASNVKALTPKPSSVKSISVTKNQSGPAVSPIASPLTVTNSPNPAQVRISSPSTVSPSQPEVNVPAPSKEEEVVPIVKAEEETPVTPKKSPLPKINEDMIARLLKEEDFEDDPISATIQRVIAQSVTDEEKSKVKFVPVKPADTVMEKKSTPKPELKPTPKSEVRLATPPIESPTAKRESLKRKSGGRKPVLSQEFIEDSDSDSSDEESRLVIDRAEDYDSVSQTEEDASASDLSKPVTTKVLEGKKLLAADKRDPKQIIEDMKSSIEKKAKLEVVKPVEQNKANEATVKAAVLVAKDRPETAKPKDSKIETAVKAVIPLANTKEGKSVVEKAPKSELPTKSLKIVDEPSRPAVTDEIKVPVASAKSEPSLSKAEKVDEPVAPEETNLVESKADELASDLSLLCEETIPGSPTPNPEHLQKDEPSAEMSGESKFLEMPFASAPGSSVAAGKALEAKDAGKPVQAQGKQVAAGSRRNGDDAAPVIENTPPTTPDSSLSATSGSPREDRADMSPTLDIESFKSLRGSFEDSSAEGGHKAEHFSEEDSMVDISMASDGRPKKLSGRSSYEPSPSKKRPRGRKRSECETVKRAKASAASAARQHASDSDDTSENSACAPLTSSENLLLPSRSPRPSRYNFYVELDPELDGSQRIALLQQKLQDLRKTYLTVKTELAGIDRRRKKLRRREREEKATKQEVACS